LRLNQSPTSVNIPNISMSSVTVDNSSVNISLTTRIIASSSDHVPDDNSSSNISLTTSISAISSDSIDVSSDNVNDRPRVWVPDVEPSLKPSKGHIFVSIDQAYDFYKQYRKLRGFDIKLGKGKVNSVANGKGKCKVTNDGFSVKRNNDDASNVSKPDDGFSRTSKNIDVAVRSLFRKNTSCKTGCLARMMIRKVDGDMFEVYGFVEEHNHPLVSQDDMQFMMSYRELGFSKQKFMLQVANSIVGLVRAFKLMKEMYGGFENVGMTATDCKNFSDNVIVFVGLSVCNKSNFKERFCRIVWNERISIDMFEHEWASIMDDFNLGEHKWLCDLYDMRHRWISAFLRDEDMYGLMRTTSRPESENQYFNRFTNPDLTLVEFIGHFESAMDIQRYTQKKNDHESRYNRPQFRTDLQLEKEAAELFTLNIFYEIQDEIIASIAKCLSVNVEQMDRFEKYYIRDTEVKKWEDSTQFEVYEVLYSSSDTILTCSCRRYELYGLLCRHILYVLRMNNVNEFLREYVLDRWSISDDNLWVDTSAFACESSSSAGIRAIRRIVEDTVDRRVPFKDKLDLYRLKLSDLLAKAKAEVSVLMRVNKKNTFCSMLGATEPKSVVIKVPRHSTNKGTGSHTRWKNMDELIHNEAESSKKRQTCFVCGRAEGHNCRTCPYKVAINAAAAANKRTKRTTPRLP
ncbi:FAR1 DNA binding domain, zinc finger, SWIM-type, MULE transposase domain containing protein, partial [Tanacetum coccineum]